MTHLKVAVRIRPLCSRETDLQYCSVVEVLDENTVAVTNLKVPEQNAGDSRERIRRFAFDHCFSEDSSQDEVFTIVEKEVENAIKSRFHSCVLAYGQSSSGKTHTMMGTSKNPGLIPSLCNKLFEYLQDYTPEVSCGKLQSTISYFEIYNEKVHDLLVLNGRIQDNAKTNNLRIREHPKKGPYVQGLIRRSVYDSDTLLHWLKTGNANRKVSATSTNPNSSRSHSVFTLTFGEGVQLHLIDLAGSEKAANKYHNICTLKEGANINKSLVALGNVISTLADHSTKTKNSRKRFVPYRDSVLTWLLKDTLGGNSKTTMIATISPSATCYNETINTLRFGQRAKKIISRPIVIDDPKESTIRELRAEIAKLKHILAQIQDTGVNLHFPTIHIEENAFPENTECVINPDQFKNNKKTFRTSEILLPVMDVTSAVNSEKKQLPKIRRTYSVETGIMNTKPRKVYGSHETISTATKDKPKRTPQPLVSSKRVVEKPPLAKRVSVKKLGESAPKKLEKGMVTEERGALKSEVPRRTVAKPRSHIVAAVTSRLYGTSKKKEAGTETEELKSPSEDVPKELSICSNARLRLQELTRKALYAHKRKTAETQTDLFPVLRVKEISTDVDDLQLALVEIKHAEVDAIKIETKDAAVNCAEKTFQDSDDDNHSFLYTKSCGTQASDLTDEQKRKSPPPTSTISFTKYLQSIKEPSIEIVNPSNGSPIYTSTVNINVSHNYINRHRLSDIPSDDSIEEINQSNNVNLPTPDIISNHNSLELGNINLSPEPQPTVSYHLCEKCASYNTIIEPLYSSKHFNVVPPNYCVANCIIIPKCEEKMSFTRRVPTYVSETYIARSAHSETCTSFHNLIAIAEVEVFEVLPLPLENAYHHVLKNNTKGCCKHSRKNLEKLRALSKTNKRRLSLPASHEVFNTMSKFMEEATTLMRNLSKVTDKLHNEMLYDVEITVNNLNELPLLSPSASVQDFSTQTCTLEETSSQTNSHQEASANTDLPFQMPTNEYDDIVQKSCNKLEELVNKIENKVTPDPQSKSPSHGCGHRHPVRKVSGCLPSTYLKQLTVLRQHIVDSTRDGLSTESKPKL
ncbi:hypothetical protein FQA39_LY07897 [Lamprigera yunnana]|nr:hypothetical protein FQA39_LY07897 [Lamprigera yunnana]